MNTKVKINFDDEDRIAQLPKIGSAIASRIVQARANQQYIRSPDDLANIAKVSLQTAKMLETEIDWSAPLVPRGKGIDPKPLDFVLATLLILLMTCFPMYFVSQVLLPDLFSVETTSSPLRIALFINYIREFCETGLFTTMSLMMVAVISAVLIDLKKRNYSFSLVFRTVIILLTGLTIFAAGVMLAHSLHLILFFFGIPLKDPMSQGVPFHIIRSFVTVMVLVFMLSLLRNPKIVLNRAYLYLLDASFFLLVISLPLWPYFHLNIYARIFTLLFMGFYFYFLIIGLRTGQTMAEQLYFFSIKYLATSSSKIQQYWMTWLNSRLPDEEQQKGLRDALNKHYPPSRIKTAMDFLFLTVGGWLIITILQSIVDYFVQNFFTNFHP